MKPRAFRDAYIQVNDDSKANLACKACPWPGVPLDLDALGDLDAALAAYRAHDCTRRPDPVHDPIVLLFEGRREGGPTGWGPF